ncbi:MAG: hypothetical protein ABID61_04725 [Candidatus Micrarchaeota archaeon]
MNSHTLSVIGRTKREIVEQKLLAKFKQVKILDPDMGTWQLDRKEGNFGMSPAAIALYANGYNPRGVSRIAPLGLYYHEATTCSTVDDAVFGIGYFRKEGTSEDDSYLMLIAPTLRALERIAPFIEKIFQDGTIPCKGVYVRFLNEYGKNLLVGHGFHPVTFESNPWNPRAPQEDETFYHSTLWIPGILRPILPTEFEVLDLENTENKEHRRKSRMAVQRFRNFLKRNQIDFRMQQIFPKECEHASGIGQKIIREHFSRLVDPVGSMAEDHFGVVHPKILKLPDIRASIGYLNDVPVSIFVGEGIRRSKNGGFDTLGLYTSITLRDNEYVLGELLGLDPYETIPNLPEIKNGPKTVSRAEGFSAISIFNLFNYFFQSGVEWIKLGGSEEKKLDDAKRQMGAKEDKTYWVYKEK